MKQLLIVLSIVLASISWSQEKRFGLTLNMSAESQRYTTDSIYDKSLYYSNISYNQDESVHGNVYAHKTEDFKIVNTMVHGGFRASIIKREVFSFSLNGQLGLGFQKSTKHSTLYYDSDEVSNPDEKRSISSVTTDGQLTASLRFNLEKYVYDPFWFSFFGGIRYLNGYQSYSMPVGGMEIGFRNWSVVFSGYFTQLNFYRTYSNGTREKANVFKDIASVAIQYEF